MKGYIALEGNFYSDWEFTNGKVFTTKKALHEHMTKTLGFGCHKVDTSYNEKNTHFENKVRMYGYNVQEVEII